MLQGDGEVFGGLVGEGERMVREQPQPVKMHAGVGVRGSVGDGMHFDRDPFELARRFRHLPTSQNRMTDDGIVLLIEAGRQRLEQRLLGEKLR